MILGLLVEPILCNSPPKFVLESSNAEVVGGDIIVRLKEGEETPPGTKIYSLKGFDADGDRLLFGVQKGKDSDLIKVVNQVTFHESLLYLFFYCDQRLRNCFGLFFLGLFQKTFFEKFIIYSHLAMNYNEKAFELLCSNKQYVK